MPAATPPVDDDDIVLLRVPADPRYARVIRVAVSAYAMRLGLAPSAVEDLRLAVDEALILLMGSSAEPGDDTGPRPDGPTIVVVLDAESDRPPVVVDLHLDPTPAVRHPDATALSRFEEIVPAGVAVDAVDQRQGRVVLRLPG